MPKNTEQELLELVGLIKKQKAAELAIQKLIATIEAKKAVVAQVLGKKPEPQQPAV